MHPRSHIIPLLLAIILIVIAIWSGLTPTDRAAWYAETMPVFIVFGLLLLTYSRFQFSGFAYFLMFIGLIIPLIGTKYTVAELPLVWLKQWLSSFVGEVRNPLDYVVHFALGFYSFPMAEWLLRKRKCTLGVALFFSLFWIISVVALYAIIEWQYALIVGREASAVLSGSQGEMWLAQKKMLADILGAVTALLCYLIVRPDRRVYSSY